MKRSIIYFFIVMLLIAGCSKVETSVEENNLSEENSVIVDSNNDLNNQNEVEIVVDNGESKENQNIEGKAISPLTGLYIDEEIIKNRPIAVMIDNYYKARPQAGLSESDIIYEILAEGNITRYLAIFHSQQPELIGPVRSARPYFISKALEFNPLYIHVGGSPQAFIDLSELKVNDIDALSSGRNIFWRESHKPKPNNMYTSTEAIKKDADRKGYSLVADFKPFAFNESDENIIGDELLDIKFPYRKTYVSGFIYNDEEKLYYRFVNGEPHKDETSQIHLSAKNIIVQFADNKVVDSEGRLEIDLLGEGKGYYITNGKYQDIIWKKPSRREQTKIYNLQGKDISLNPGKTWYQIIPTSMDVIQE